MSNGKSQTGIFVLLGLLVVAVAVFLIHLGGGKTPPNKIQAPEADGSKASDVLDINVFLDGSGSIRHFLQTAPAGDGVVQTNYVSDLLNKCETTLHNAPGEGVWKDQKLRFWRFGSGDTPTPLPKEAGLASMSKDLKQFNERDTMIETPIRFETAGDGSDPRPELKIILTDLYQSNGQVERPGNALADKYLHNDKDTDAVGILAVRNTFTGPVEDLPGSRKGVTLPDAADSMPFYVIFAGRDGDVRHAMDVLIAGTSLQEAIDKGRATEFFFSRAPQAHGTEPMKFSQAPYSMLSKNYKDSHVQLIGLSKGTLQATWNDSRPGDAHFVKMGGGEELVPTVSSVGPDGTLKKEPGIEAVEKCKDGSLLCVNIDRAKLTKGTTYAFRFDRVLTKESDALEPGSEALQHWNIEVADAERISAEKKPVFPPVPGLRGRPGLTPDLSKFLSALQGQMFHAPVRVTSYYLYVQAN